MRIQLNGEPADIPDDLTVEGLVARLGLAGRRCAVEIDGEVVPRSAHAARALADGARVEIIHAIGGG